MFDPLICIVYGLPSALLFVGYLRRRRRMEMASARAHQLAQASGLKEPSSLHPLVDPSRCIGCGTCVKVCPEQPERHVLGILGGRAELVSPSDCIGHGACRAACPVEAISLVFGSERRGVEIPLLSPQFETSVPGIFIAGELGGMGLIRNALEQGRQAVEAIHSTRPGGGEAFDLVIVGAGPAGFAASLTAMSRRMRFVTLEQESLGGSIFQYPRGKMVMTAPATVPIIGKIDLRQTSKESLLEFWRDVERKSGLQIRYGERVEDIMRAAQCFRVKTSRGEHLAHNVLLAIGRRGSPRKLDVPGEELPKVVYRLIDPEQYSSREVLVVGGGDSALEAATTLTAGGCASVALSYRGDAFSRAKPRNRERVEAAEQAGVLRVLLRSNLKRIEPASVLLEQDGKPIELRNDAVIISAGGVLPAEFLRRIGIHVETKYGTA